MELSINFPGVMVKGEGKGRPSQVYIELPKHMYRSPDINKAKNNDWLKRQLDAELRIHKQEVRPSMTYIDGSCSVDRISCSLHAQ